MKRKIRVKSKVGRGVGKLSFLGIISNSSELFGALKNSLELFGAPKISLEQFEQTQGTLLDL